MEVAILQFMLRAEEQVFKKHFEILARGVNPFLQIVVVGANKRVAEVPGVGGEHIVVHREAEGLQVFHDEDRGRARVSLAEGMDLPDAGRKLCHVLDRFRDRKRVIGELFFLRKIIIQRVADALPGRIDDRIAAEYPLIFCDVVGAELSRVIKDASRDDYRRQRKYWGFGRSI